MKLYLRISAFLATVLLCSWALAQEAPQVQRHDLMEDVGAAAKQIGRMLEGETSFDAARAMNSFETWQSASGEFGDMFPAGSETGYDTRAKLAIWSNRIAFNEALEAWGDAVDAAIAANPQDLEALKAAAGPVFKKCKACHEEFREEKD